MAELDASPLGALLEAMPVVVHHSKTNAIRIFALVEQWILTEGRGRSLLELVVFASRRRADVTLEQVSAGSTIRSPQLEAMATWSRFVAAFISQ